MAPESAERELRTGTSGPTNLVGIHEEVLTPWVVFMGLPRLIGLEDEGGSVPDFG